MSKSILSRVLGTAAAVALGLAAAGAHAADGKVKAGFVYVGPHNDGGYSQQHDMGRLEAQKNLGDKVETFYVESVPEGADAERVIRQMAASGADIIFTTSFGFMDATIKVAKQFPKVKFEHATGYKTAANVGIYNARFYEGRAVIGTMAGRLTKTNKIGYVASFPIPEVIQGINSATLAARAVNPNVTMSVVWVNSWYDPGKEAAAAQALLDQGVDVIMQHTDSPAPLQAAAERGFWGFGQSADMHQYAPDAQATGIVDHWGDYYTQRIQAVIDGTWKPDNTWGGFAANMVNLGTFSDKLPADVKAEALKVEDDIKTGKRHPFQGPIKKQDGSEVIPAGKTLSDDELSGMNYYVEGVIGTIPN
jgi:simple sugar transport system substrate-binding protein